MADDSYLRPYLAGFPSCRVAVVGDLMLDRYIWGKAGRISQEAPVPVVKVDHETFAMGGAANVTANLLALGGKVSTYGIVGDDASGQRLKNLMQEAGADITGVVYSDNRRTTLKTRVLGNHQQVVRIDEEDASSYGKDRAFGELTDKITKAITEKQFDALVFEDYAKGLLNADFIQHLNDIARENDVLTALDPHPANNFKTADLCALTPNRAEAFALTGHYQQPGTLPLEADQALMQVADDLLRAWRPYHLLITLGAEGMALFSKSIGQRPAHIPTRAKAVYDVSGAGDTVTATFILGLLAGTSPADAARLANHAAGIVVGKVGTMPVDKDELWHNLEFSYEENQDSLSR